MAAPMRYGDYVKEGWGVVKQNLVPWVLAYLVMGIAGMCTFGIIMPILVHNFLGMCRDAKREGKAPEIGGLFKFDNFLNIWLAAVVPMLPFALVYCLCLGVFPFIIGMISAELAIIGYALGGLVALVVGTILGVVMFWVMVLVVDKQLPWMTAIKTSLRYAKGGLVGHLILSIVLGITAGIGILGCGVGLLVTVPIAANALWHAYEDHAAGLAEVIAQVEGGAAP